MDLGRNALCLAITAALASGCAGRARVAPPQAAAHREDVVVLSAEAAPADAAVAPLEVADAAPRPDAGLTQQERWRASLEGFRLTEDSPTRCARVLAEVRRSRASSPPVVRARAPEVCGAPQWSPWLFGEAACVAQVRYSGGGCSGGLELFRAVARREHDAFEQCAREHLSARPRAAQDFVVNVSLLPTAEAPRVDLLSPEGAPSPFALCLASTFAGLRPPHEEFFSVALRVGVVPAPRGGARGP